MKVYDCFLFHKEFDLLEVRLRHLYDWVDRFVIVEGSLTHRGDPKKFLYEENASRFAWAADKIKHVKVDLSMNPEKFAIENTQRNGIALGVQDADPDDIIMVSDCDEMPSHVSIQQIKQAPDADSIYEVVNNEGIRVQVSRNQLKQVGMNGLPCGFLQKACGWYANMYDPRAMWIGTVATTAKEFQTAGSAQYFRQYRYRFPRIIDGGCHFTFIGELQDTVTKLKSFSHMEFDTEDNTNPTILCQRRDAGEDPFGTKRFFGQELSMDDVNFPPYLRDNQSAYPIFIKKWK